jgi:hypothetical protein
MERVVHTCTTYIHTNIHIYIHTAISPQMQLVAQFCCMQLQTSCAAHCIWQTYCTRQGRSVPVQQARAEAGQGRWALRVRTCTSEAGGGAHPQSMILEASCPIQFLAQEIFLLFRSGFPPSHHRSVLLACLCVRAAAPCLLACLLAAPYLFLLALFRSSFLALGCRLRAASSSCCARKHNLGSICRAVPSLPCPPGP